MYSAPSSVFILQRIALKNSSVSSSSKSIRVVTNKLILDSETRVPNLAEYEYQLSTVAPDCTALISSNYLEQSGGFCLIIESMLTSHSKTKKYTDHIVAYCLPVHYDN